MYPHLGYGQINCPLAVLYERSSHEFLPCHGVLRQQLRISGMAFGIPMGGNFFKLEGG